MHYQCQRCGNCCRWPGDVVLTDDDITRAADFLGLPEPEFIAQHTHLSKNRQHLSLKEKPNGECAFLEGLNVCGINAAKPAQCSGFPNQWRFPGWRDSCEAIPVETPDNSKLAQTPDSA